MIPDYKEMIVGLYNFIDTEKHGKYSYDMLRAIKSFERQSNMTISLHNNLSRWRNNG